MMTKGILFKPGSQTLASPNYNMGLVQSLSETNWTRLIVSKGTNLRFWSCYSITCMSLKSRRLISERVTLSKLVLWFDLALETCKFAVVRDQNFQGQNQVFS